MNPDNMSWVQAAVQQPVWNEIKDRALCSLIKTRDGLGELGIRTLLTSLTTQWSDALQILQGIDLGFDTICMRGIGEGPEGFATSHSSTQSTM